jgi:hypothetical protein
VPLRTWSVVNALHVRGSGSQVITPSHMSRPFEYCGCPRTSEEWAALAKIAAGQADLSKNELRCLFMLGLVERQLGSVRLTHHGRETLGRAQ